MSNKSGNSDLGTASLSDWYLGSSCDNHRIPIVMRPLPAINCSRIGILTDFSTLCMNKPLFCRITEDPFSSPDTAADPPITNIMFVVSIILSLSIASSDPVVLCGWITGCVWTARRT